MYTERRFVSKVELRVDSQGVEGAMVISGYAARFGKLSERLGGGSFREVIQRGAFARSLQSDRDVACLVNHDPSLLLGRKKNGTLTCSEDTAGLRFRCNIANTTVGRDTYNLIKRGDIDGCSFAFAVADPDGEDWSEQIDDPETGERIALRKIIRANLFDCSVVQSPAYPSTSVSASSLPELNSLWPMGLPQSMPLEVRSHILRSQNRDVRAEAARQRMITLMLS